MHLSFEPVQSEAIKSFTVEQSTNKGGFSPIKILDPGCKHFYRQYVSDYPLEVLQG